MNEKHISQLWALIIAPLAIVAALVLALFFAVAIYARSMLALIELIENGIFYKVSELANQQAKLFTSPLRRAFSHEA